MGVSVSATETIGCSDAMYEVDPYTDEGIEEAEITTVLLSESATAKEAVELLLSIYDSVGAAGGSGIFIAGRQGSVVRRKRFRYAVCCRQADLDDGVFAAEHVGDWSD